MDGPWHYAESERLLSLGQDSKAQVHAILALTAATLDPFGFSPAHQWQKILGFIPEDAQPTSPQDAV